MAAFGAFVATAIAWSENPRRSASSARMIAARHEAPSAGAESLRWRPGRDVQSENPAYASHHRGAKTTVARPSHGCRSRRAQGTDLRGGAPEMLEAANVAAARGGCEAVFGLNAAAPRLGAVLSQQAGDQEAAAGRACRVLRLSRINRLMIESLHHLVDARLCDLAHRRRR